MGRVACPLDGTSDNQNKLKPLNSSHPMNPYHTASLRSPITHRHIPATRHRRRIRPPRTPLRCLLRDRRHTGLDIRVLLDHIVFVSVIRQGKDERQDAGRCVVDAYARAALYASSMLVNKFRRFASASKRHVIAERLSDGADSFNSWQ
jgi:hypothetical protein